MKYFVVFLILIGFGFIYHAYAELDKSILEPFENSDLVIIGTVIQVNTIPSENKTQYNIKVEEYLKGQKSFDMITAILDKTRPVDFPQNPLDYYNRPYFEKDNQVFVYLKQEGATFKMSPYSFTIKKPMVVGPPTVIHSTGPQEHYFSQGDEIVISGTVKKGYLYGLEKSDLDSGFHLVVLNERGEQVDSKKLIISPDGNYKFLFQNKGDLRIPGKYSWEINFENGEMGGEFVVVADSKLWTPLKQFKAGILYNSIQCKDSLVLLQKYDGSPVCVTNDIGRKLVERGWATCDYQVKFTRGHPCGISSSSGISSSPEIMGISVVKDGKTFDVKYLIKGGTVTDMTYSNNTNSLLITIDVTHGGDLEVTIPRNLLDAKMDYCPPRQTNAHDDRFFVMLDGEEIFDNEILTTVEARTLKLPFDINSEKIEIIGTCFV